MTELLTFLAAMVWLFAGGWAFWHFLEGIAKDAVGGLLLMCILIGPFMAGAAFADQRRIHSAGKDA